MKNCIELVQFVCLHTFQIFMQTYFDNLYSNIVDSHPEMKFQTFTYDTHEKFIKRFSAAASRRIAIPRR